MDFTGIIIELTQNFLAITIANQIPETNTGKIKDRITAFLH